MTLDGRREAWIVVDMGFGDSGKGTLVDFLVRERGAGLVVRFNGGAQAGHNVVTPDGRHHTFSQLGAGSFVPGVETHLASQVAIHPYALILEADHAGRAGITDGLARTTIDSRARVITPFQQAAGRLRELLRGDARHGSCGVGFGEAVADSLNEPGDTVRAADLADRPLTLRKLRSQQERKRSELVHALGSDAHPALEVEWGLLEDAAAPARVQALWEPFRQRARVLAPDAVRERLQAAGALVFEGAQGVLLDEEWGFHPHTTWSDCTFGGAMALLEAVSWDAPVTRLGVLRAYATRHGRGPFPTEDPAWTARLTEPHNADGPWQGPFRTGAQDRVLTRYALEVCGGADALAVTCMDQLAAQPVARTCEAYLGYRDEPAPVTRLPVGAPGDLEQRTRLGEALRLVQPVMSTRSSGDELLSSLEAEVGVAVRLTSYGPTALEKRWR